MGVECDDARVEGGYAKYVGCMIPFQKTHPFGSGQARFAKATKAGEARTTVARAPLPAAMSRNPLERDLGTGLAKSRVSKATDTTLGKCRSLRRRARG